MYSVSCEILSNFTMPINIKKPFTNNDFYLLEHDIEESSGRYSLY